MVSESQLWIRRWGPRIAILALIAMAAFFVLRPDAEGAEREKALRTSRMYLTALVEGPPENVNELTCRTGEYASAPANAYAIARRAVAGKGDVLDASVSDDPVSNVTLRDRSAVVRGTAQTSSGDVDLRLRLRRQSFLGTWLVCGIEAEPAG